MLVVVVHVVFIKAPVLNRNLVLTNELFFFSHSLFLLFLSRNHLPKGGVCLSVPCVKTIVWSLKSFVYIDCFCTISRNNVREKQRRLSLNRIAKEEA